MGKVDKSFKPRLNEATLLPFNIDEIVKHYLIAAMWAEENEENGLKEKTIDDIDQQSKAQAKMDVIQFLKLADEQAKDELMTYDAQHIGHNLWLSRNGHGAGFFDDNNDKLQNIARGMKSRDIYVGDDGKVYIQ